MAIIKLKDAENAAEIFRNNNDLRNKVFEDAQDDAYYQADEILSYFRHYNKATGRRYDTLKDYEIGYCRAWTAANTDYLKEFFEDCAHVQKVLAPFEEKQAETITRILEKIDLYEDEAAGYETGLNDTNYCRLENWIYKNMYAACAAIANYAQSFYTQFDDNNLFEDYFLTFWLETGRGEDLQLNEETGEVFETITTTTIYK